MPASLDTWDGRLRTLFGLSLLDHPARLRDGLRAACTDIGVDDDEQLLERVDHGDAGAKSALARALTIGETYFFREPHHFDILRETLLPAALDRAHTPVTMVSAACSSGEEAYSMAIVARQVLGAAADGRVQVVGFDVNERAIAAARRGQYRAWAMRGMPFDVRQRWFEPAADDEWSIAPAVRSLTTFERRNLVDAAEVLPPASADIVFCRNVLIYFDPPSVALVLKRLAESLRPHGSLVVSSAEGALFESAGLGAHQVGDAWVHTRGEVRPQASPPPLSTKRVSPAPAPRRSLVKRAAAAPAEPSPLPARAAPTERAEPLDLGWAMLAANPMGAAEQARRAILLDRTSPAAHLLAASASLALEDVPGARRALRHARRYLSTAVAGEVLRGSGGATTDEMTSYCARLERALRGREE